MSCFEEDDLGIWATGMTSEGTVAQLVRQGPLGARMYLDPCNTFWRAKIARCTNFSMESVLREFDGGNVAFGAQASAVITNDPGDLLFWVYLVLDLPGIRAARASQADGDFDRRPPNIFPHQRVCDVDEDEEDDEVAGADVDADATLDSDDSECDAFGLRRPWAHWVNKAGFAAVRMASYGQGGSILGCLPMHYLNCWEELTGHPGKRLKEMIFRHNSKAELVRLSRRNQRLYVPLPFHFTQHSVSAFPVVPLFNRSLRIHVHFNALQNMIQVSDRNVLVVKTADNQLITNDDMRALLDTTMVYLDLEERARFALGRYEQLITQVSYSVTSAHLSDQVVIPLNLNFPTLETIVFAQRDCQRITNNTFNYAGAYCEDPIRRIRLTIDGLIRFDREAAYLRMVQPYQYHTRIPKDFIYVYCYALDTEGPQPSSTLDFSEFDQVQLVVYLQRELAEHLSSSGVQIHVLSRNWQIIRFESGLVYQVYSIFERGRC
jgi:hypothetical protein